MTEREIPDRDEADDVERRPGDGDAELVAQHDEPEHRSRQSEHEEERALPEPPFEREPEPGVE